MEQIGRGKESKRYPMPSVRGTTGSMVHGSWTVFVALFLTVFTVGCEDVPNEVGTKAASRIDSIQINVFFESSMSMDGFVRGDNEFEAAMMSLLGGVARTYDGNVILNKSKVAVHQVLSSMNLYSVTSGDGEVDAQQLLATANVDDVDQWFKHVEPQMLGGGKQRSTTELRDVLKLALDSARKGAVSVLISDMILSLDGSQVRAAKVQSSMEDERDRLERVLQKEQAQILNTVSYVLRKSDHRMAMMAFRFLSRYDGTYAPEVRSARNGKPSAKRVVFDSRPYFVWIVGEANDVLRIAQSVNVKLLTEHRLTNTCFLVEPVRRAIAPRYSIVSPLNLTYPRGSGTNVGRYTTKDNGQTLVVQGLDDGRMVYAVDVALPSDNKYAKVEARTEQSKSMHQDRIMGVTPERKGLRRVFVESMYGSKARPSNASKTVIAFYYQKPRWFSDCSNSDDSNTFVDSAAQESTFGLRQLMDGMWGAFYPTEPLIGSISIDCE